VTAGTLPRPPHAQRARQWLPPQHGAWALLAVPYLAGVIAAGLTWWELPLLVAVLAGYPLSYYGLLAAKTHRLDRVGAQIAGYGLVTAAALVPLLVARPALLAYAPVYALLLAANAGYARRRRERALANDLIFVVESGVLVFVVGTVAGTPLGTLVTAFGAVVLYGASTVLFVKTMIRERGRPGYRHASVAFHAVALAVAVLLDPVLAVPFGAYLVRAVLLPGREIRPARVGMVELAGALLLLAALAVAYA
jgi:hypothetical protein